MKFDFMGHSSINKIRSIIGNGLLAKDLHSSISTALKYPGISFSSGNTVWEVFSHSLNAAIRDIENHPQGKLFRRLIEFGPLSPGEPEKLLSDQETTLSDPECAECVEFIYSHMVNRFKGELAELLALQPCIDLIQHLQEGNHLPKYLNIFWGEDVKESRPLYDEEKPGIESWSGFSKGADGLLIQYLPNTENSSFLEVLGIVEVKSMNFTVKKIDMQLSRHVNRLRGGVMIGNKFWNPEKVFIKSSNINNHSHSDLIRIMVIPSSWKLSRNWKYSQNELIPPPNDVPPISTKQRKLCPNTWKITLAWSEEALHQAAYEMTFWYFSQVGQHIYHYDSLPKGWEDMTPEEAGYNAIKMMLYYIPFRYISQRHVRKAIRLYNIYSFGYPLGIDSQEMIWPEDFANLETKLPYESPPADWRDFQEKVAALFRKLPWCKVYTDYAVYGNKIRKRNVDVFVKFAFLGKHAIKEDNTKLKLSFDVIVECKYWKKKIPQDVIFSLQGIVQDTGAAMGILVTESGFQKGIREYLNHPGNISAITYDELKESIFEEYLPSNDLESSISGDRQAKNVYNDICEGCGNETIVAFNPLAGHIFCKDCMAKYKIRW